jgi:hypothetical protein
VLVPMLSLAQRVLWPTCVLIRSSTPSRLSSRRTCMITWPCSTWHPPRSEWFPDIPPHSRQTSAPGQTAAELRAAVWRGEEPLVRCWCAAGADPASPLDGLNKPYGTASVHYFRERFNSLSAKQCGVTIEWHSELRVIGSSRMGLTSPIGGYICQIARFDPSKGEFCARRQHRQDPARQGCSILAILQSSRDTLRRLPQASRFSSRRISSSGACSSASTVRQSTVVRSSSSWATGAWTTRTGR